VNRYVLHPGYVVKQITHQHFGPDPVHVFALDVRHNGGVQESCAASCARSPGTKC
jgi:hypothetical protein